MINLRGRTPTTYFLLASTIFTCPAVAEAQSTSTNTPQVTQTGDIVVTAQRREEKIKDVPAQVTVLDGDRIQQMALSDVVSVVEHLPAISFQQTGDPRTDMLSIRGIATLANIPGVEPDAAIVIDGETLARNAQLDMNLGDIKRVELLEGPQGTLFGKNAVAGMLNIVTTAPSLSDGLSGKVSAGIAEYGDYRLKAGINVPLSPTVAAMVNGYWAQTDGWVPNANAGQPNGGKGHGWGVRGQLLWEPASNLEVLLRVEGSRKVVAMPSTVLVNLTQADVDQAGGGANTAMTAWYNNFLKVSGITLPLVNNNHTYLNEDRVNADARNFAFSGRVTYSLGSSKLIYNGSYRNYRLNSNDNELGIPVNLAPLMYAGPSNYKTIQQELRIESDSNQRLRYTGGLFYYHLNDYRRETDVQCWNAMYSVPNVPAPTSLANFNCASYGGPVSSGPYNGYNIEDYASSVVTDNYAVFGQAEYDLTHNLTAFVGGRYLTEKQTMTYQTFADDNEGPAYLTPFSAAATHSHFIDREGLRFKAGDATFFATHSTGFKGVAWDNGGGKNISEFVGPSAFAPAPPEVSRQFEIGVKGDALDRRISYGLTLFDLRVHNYQARVNFFDPSNPAPTVQRLQNAGTLGSDGVEARIDFRPDNHWTFGTSVNWIHARFTSDTYIACNSYAVAMGACIAGADGQMLQNLKGQAPTNAPKFSADANAQYAFAGPGGLENSVRLDFRHRASQNNTISPDPFEIQPAYSIFDLSYNLHSSDQRYSLTLYVKNLMNKFYYQRPFEPAGIGWGAGENAVLPMDYKRYFGAVFTSKF